jgi:serine/threonine protein kinase/formylglycine-generating enzyme required for sulfatase activity
MGSGSGFSLTEGTIFAGDYRVARLLGAGGMGEVYVVHQLSTGRDRALKVMSPHLAPNEEQRRRFQLEARVGAMIESDHVVDVITAGFDEQTGAPYLVMELLEGETLEAKVGREGALARAEVARIFDELGHALAAAHAKGIVHRDLKPANLFLARPRVRTPNPILKVLDFGVAKLVGGTHATDTRQVGTPSYMAPEQCRAEPVFTATDVWALGLIAFKLLTGKLYWCAAHRPEASALAIMYEIGHEPLEPATSRADRLGAPGRLPPGFDAWFARCVARDVIARYPEAGAACEALIAVLGGPTTASSELPPPGASGTPGMAASGSMGSHPITADALPTLAPGVAPLTGAAGVLGPPTTNAPSVIESGHTPPTLGAPARSPQSPPAPIGVGTPRASGTPGGDTLQTGETRKDAAPSSSGVGARVALLLGALALIAATAVGTAYATRPAQRTKLAVPAPFSIACPEGTSWIPPGTFRRKAGSQKVAVAGFCMDRLEVTVGDYDRCVKAGACAPPAATIHSSDYEESEVAWRNLLCPGARLGPKPNQPVTCVDPRMAKSFCAWRGRRLPTDVEFEWAARGGDRATPFPWGTHVIEASHACSSAQDERGMSEEVASPSDWHPAEGTFGSCEVGSHPKGANPWGVQDLVGNVWETVASNQDGEVVYQTAGGGFNTGSDRYLTASGFWSAAWPADGRDADTGFRCVAEPR